MSGATAVAPRQLAPSTPDQWVIVDAGVYPHDAHPYVTITLRAPLRHEAHYVGRDAAWWILWWASTYPGDSYLAAETIEAVAERFGPLAELAPPAMPPLPGWWAAYEQGGDMALGCTIRLEAIP